MVGTVGLCPSPLPAHLSVRQATCACIHTTRAWTAAQDGRGKRSTEWPELETESPARKRPRLGC